MKKIITIIVLSIVGLGIVVWALISLYQFNQTKQVSLTETSSPVVTTSSSVLQDVKNSSYVIDGTSFKLVDGIAVNVVAPSFASRQTITIFGEPLYSDFNGDGKNDGAVILMRTGEGAGIFYYAALAIATGTGYQPTNTILLGDRIAPQLPGKENGRAVFNYAERKPGEAVTAQPSIGKSLFIEYSTTTGQISEWVKNSVNTGDPQTMHLTMKKWVWVKTQTNDGKIVVPKKPDAFTITFTENNKISVTTDCNGTSGSYTEKNTKLTLNNLASTMMYCDGSQEAVFSKALSGIRGYLFTSNGELILDLAKDSGVMVFK
jgi:heat shock protein HslJ